MKLQTSIKPRRDGTVKVTGQDRQTYTFAPGPDGTLECDVDDVPTLKLLLRLENDFWPTTQEDSEIAMALINPPGETDPNAEDERDPSEKADGDLNLDDDEDGDPDAPPVEGMDNAPKGNGLAPEADPEKRTDKGSVANPLTDADMAADLAGTPRPTADAATLLGSDKFEAVIAIGQRKYQLADVVALAHAASGLPVEAWNALGEQERDDLIADQIDAMDEAEGATGGQPDEANTPPKTAPDKAAKHNAAVQKARKRGAAAQ